MLKAAVTKIHPNVALISIIYRQPLNPVEGLPT